MKSLSPTSELYQSLEFAYEFFNKSLFGGALTPVIFTVREARGTSAYYSHKRMVKETTGELVDEIAMNLRVVGQRRLLNMLETLVHEMVHKAQFDFGEPSRRAYHNLQFSELMAAVGLITSHNGRKGGKRVGEKMASYPQPGGPFIYACIKLMQEHKFSMTWVDRYQIEFAGNGSANQERDLLSLIRPEEDYTPPTVDGVCIDSSIYEVKLTSSNDETTEVDLKDFLENHPEISEGNEKVHSMEGDGSETFVELAKDLMSPPSNKAHLEFESSNSLKAKVMYRCPECRKTKVWGKPALKIGCLECQVKMVEKVI